VISDWKREDWVSMDNGGFAQIFKHSAVKRAGFAKLKENIGFLNEKKSETS
jgi:epoxyqueuosine reductase QueG